MIVRGKPAPLPPATVIASVVVVVVVAASPLAAAGEGVGGVGVGVGLAGGGDPFAACKPDASSLDLVLDCGDIALTVEEEVGGEARAMLTKHLAGVREDFPAADVDDIGVGTSASYGYNDVIAAVEAAKLADVTRVVSCGGPKDVAKKRCASLIDALMKRGSTVAPSFFRARDLETAWLLSPPTPDCRVRRGNVVLTYDCELYGFTVAKADADAKKRDANIRRMVSELERAAGVPVGIHASETCKLRGARGTCLRASMKGVRVVVVAAVVAGEPLQARCDWEGAAELPAACALHILLAEADR